MIDYNKFEFISYKNYEIDHDINKNLLKTLNEFAEIIKKNPNLNYYLSGSICLSFLTNKIYRTWKDIDIIIEKNKMWEWIHLFSSNEWYYHDYNKYHTKIYHKYNDNYIELLSERDSLFFYKKKYLNITNFDNLKIGSTKPMFFWKKNIRKTKNQKDEDDENFYKQYLDV